MGMVCFEGDALKILIEEISDRIKVDKKITHDRWITPEHAMELLNIRKTTLQKLRKGGQITYTQPQKKTILYDYESIMNYLDNSAIKKF